MILGAAVFISCLSSENRNGANSLSNHNRATAVLKRKVTNSNYNPKFPPPPDQKDTFVLRQDYPDMYHSEESFPWKDINFKINPDQYMQTILNYCLEGNLEADFRIQDNKIRNWYHTPWLHDDGREAGNGREYHRGLTRERASPPLELHRNQDREIENWAIGFYNEPGGYTIGKIWADPVKPDPSQSNFPEGTVSFKLLFTAGTIDQVPFLEGAKEWTANIYPCNPKNAPSPDCLEPTKRIDKNVRLLQIDIAVKDGRAGEVGWVFGTFIYDASRTGSNVWEKMAPVGLSWGDDSTISSMMRKKGAFLNPDLKQTYLNAGLIESADPNKNYTNEAYLLHHGLGGRLNGPVDNPVSSCISCHARAGVTQDGEPMLMGNLQASRPDYTEADFKNYFSTIKGGANSIQIGSKTFMTTDYSLQIAAGIRNYYRSLTNKPTGSNPSARTLDENITNLPIVTRGEK